MRFLAAVPLALTLCVPAAAAAQNREHQQLFADLRMLQEQVQRIQLALNTLGEQVEATNARLDAQDAATRKDFADQQYRIGLIDETLGTLREKLNDNTVRVSQLIQEVDAVREGIVVLQSLLNQILVQLTPMAEGDPDTAAGAPPSFGAPPGGFATDPSRRRPPGPAPTRRPCRRPRPRVIAMRSGCTPAAITSWRSRRSATSSRDFRPRPTRRRRSISWASPCTSSADTRKPSRRFRE
jgi:hypothetical protein